MTARKTRRLIGVLVAAGLVTSVSSFAADGDEVHPGIEALLKKVEQRISANHMMSPEGDSALDAWKQVLQKIPATDPVRVKQALTNFAVHLRRRANEERHAGNITLSAGLSIFASQAEELKTQGATSAPSADAGLTPGGSSDSSLTPAVPAANAEETPPPPTSTLAQPADMVTETPAAGAGSAQAAAEAPRLYDLPQPNSDLRQHSPAPPRRRVHALEIEIPPPRTLETELPKPGAKGVIQRLLY